MIDQTKISIEDFESVLARAQDCLFSSDVMPIYQTDQSIATRYNHERQRHEIHTTLRCSFIDRLCSKARLKIEEGWFLALAHESGHVELNQRCLDARADPAETGNQLAAIGIRTPGTVGLIAECHKESAIEAYCDAKLASAVFIHFPGSVKEILNAIYEIRKEDSGSPKKFGDDYRTHFAIAEIIKKGMPIDAASAALTAYNSSIASMSAMQNAWLSIKLPFFQSMALFSGSTKSKLSEWRRESRLGEKANDEELKKPPPGP